MGELLFLRGNPHDPSGTITYLQGRLQAYKEKRITSAYHDKLVKIGDSVYRAVTPQGKNALENWIEQNLVRKGNFERGSSNSIEDF